MLGERPKENPQRGHARATDYLVGGALGAAQGFFDNQSKEHEAAKLRKEQDRQNELLELKEARAAKREERKAGIEHGYKMNELGAKQKFDAEEGQKNRAAKVFDDANKDELERWKTTENNAKSIEVAKIGAEARKARQAAVGDDKERRKVLFGLEKEHAKLVAGWEMSGNEGEPPDFDTWAEENRTNSYRFAMGEGDQPAVPRGTSIDGGAVDSGQKPSKIDAIFDSVVASRVKPGANSGQKPPAAQSGGDIVQPAPISVDKGGDVTSLEMPPAPVKSAGNGEAQAASAPTEQRQAVAEAVVAVSGVKDKGILSSIVDALVEFSGRNAAGGANDTLKQIKADLRKANPNSTEKAIDLMAKEIVEKAQPGKWGSDFKW
jgi:hypothetical protein